VSRSQLAGYELPAASLNGVSSGSGCPFSRNMGYLARAFLNGFSAKAAKIIDVPELFISLVEFLILKPFERMSIACVELVLSTEDSLAQTVSTAWLYWLRLVSAICHEFTVAVDLIKMYFGLNPQNTNGPSADALPV